MTHADFDEGFVWLAGKPQPAMREKKSARFGHLVVFRFPKQGDGIACGKKVAATFVKHPWKGIESPEQLEAKLHTFREINRLVPQSNMWGSGGYDCKICGAHVVEQVKHFYYHTDPDRAMRTTLIALFGGK